jgi:selenide,water dikinase
MNTAIRLTELAHGGGCGCKISPALLAEILADLPEQVKDPALLVGRETNDDAAVYRLDDDTAVVATTDFFMPVVDDPFDFGAIAAANALSDIYAVGGRPLFALAVVGMPTAKLPPQMVAEVLAGGADTCAKAGIVVAGGHSIDAPEPIYGLAVVGLVKPERIKRNSTGRAADVLILGKGLGVGILCAAFKQQKLSHADYRQMMATTKKLNSIGADLGAMDGVHAMTDVTGFGLIGHLTEMCGGSGLAARLQLGQIPLLSAAVSFAKAGENTGAGTRNREAFGGDVTLPDDLEDWHRNLLFDPQTSGGLLVACAPDAADRILALFHDQGYAQAAVIGALSEGAPGIRVER